MKELSPVGWHTPSYAELEALQTHVGQYNMWDQMRTTDWLTANAEGSTNSTGFRQNKVDIFTYQVAVMVLNLPHSGHLNWIQILIHTLLYFTLKLSIYILFLTENPNSY